MEHFRRDRRGVGSFVEAAVSMIVIAMAVMVLFTALLFNAANGSSDPNEARLQQGLNVLESSLRGDRALWVEEGIMSCDGLRAMHPQNLTGATLGGYAIYLEPVNGDGGPDIEVTFGSPQKGDFIESRLIPINACSEPGCISACSLILLVW